jgi:hypothetical protein
MNDRVSLATLGNGAAVEMFDAELQRILDNIIDPNTKPTAIRSATLTVKIKPDEDREWGSVDIQACSKLASVQAYPTQIIIGKQNGKGVATEHNPKQIDAFRDIPHEGKIVPMKKEVNSDQGSD